MKRLIACFLCIMLSVPFAFAERLVTPTPPPEAFMVEISIAQEWNINDVLLFWSNQEQNNEAFKQLDTLDRSNSRPISKETLLRLLITYCIEVNPDTTCQHMIDYTPIITMDGSNINISMMTHNRGFTITVDAYTGRCSRLMVDEESGIG